MEREKDTRAGKRALLLYIAVAVLMLVLSALSFVGYQEKLDATLAEKTRQDLDRYTSQSILLFQNMLDGYFRQLDTVSLFCSTNSGVNDQEIMEMLHGNNSGNLYARLGVSDMQGRLYTGMAKPVDISGQDYFKRAAAGERVISGVEENHWNGRDTLVLSVPILRGGRIEGTAVAQYDVQAFTALLGNSQFEGTGATMVMQRDGRMLSGYEGMEKYDTFYEALEVMEFRGGDTLESLERRVRAGEQGFFTYYHYGRGRYICFRPTGVNDYVMISLVAAESMDKQFRSISAQAFALMVKNVFYYCVVLVCIWGISRIVRRLLWNIQKDQLTQAYNKGSARALMEHFLKRQGAQGIHACLFLDIDNFKEINDRYGHNAGDKLLIALTGKLQQSFRKADIISRFGGDEFVVWMKNIPSRELAGEKAELLCRVLRDIESLPVSVSIGIACYPQDGTTCDEIMHRADMALYRAKESGKNRYCMYDAAELAHSEPPAAAHDEV